MKPLSADTHPDVERIHVELLSRAGPGRRARCRFLTLNYLLVGGLLLASLVAVPAAASTPGAWPMYRGDARLTGRAALPGAMDQPPEVAWQYPIEAGEVWALVDPAPDSGQLTPEYLQAVEEQKWGLGPRLVDLYGDGTLVPDPGRAARLLPDVPGLQTVEFPLAPDQPGVDPRQVVCYAYDGGQKREVWRSEVFDTVQNTNYVVADIDGDGLLEIAFAPHYRVIVIDGQTGRTKHLLRMHNLRNYGFFATVDVDRDGLLDFVIIADFAMHVEVVKNEGDRLRLLWRRDIEQDIQSKSRIIRPGPSPVLDLNGDGRMEIVFNLFNEQDDGEFPALDPRSSPSSTATGFRRWCSRTGPRMGKGKWSRWIWRGSRSGEVG